VRHQLKPPVGSADTVCSMSERTRNVVGWCVFAVFMVACVVLAFQPGPF
jgi:hypothetical protein